MRNRLHWSGTTADHIVAQSILHNDGVPFEYRVAHRDGYYSIDDTDSELLGGDWPKDKHRFRSIGYAQAFCDGLEWNCMCTDSDTDSVAHVLRQEIDVLKNRIKLRDDVLRSAIVLIRKWGPQSAKDEIDNFLAQMEGNEP